MSTPIATAKDRHRRFVFHPFTALDRHEQVGSPTMIVRAAAPASDIHGRTYLDAMAGLWCVNVGYGRNEIAEAITRRPRRSSTTTRSRRWPRTRRRCSPSG